MRDSLRQSRAGEPDRRSRKREVAAVGEREGEDLEKYIWVRFPRTRKMLVLCPFFIFFFEALL